MYLSMPRAHSLDYYTAASTHHTEMIDPSTSTSTHNSSHTTMAVKTQQATQHHALSTKSLKAALKKPFQGWSMDLMRAKDDDDDHYNFASSAPRGTQDYRNDR
ncbi:hypothetical protein J1614_006886 [Plenodomus biglobosus]|nr:hypothetical protein J1614_006886 [Plenodomus biglobosus]